MDTANFDCCEIGVSEGVVLQSVTLAPDVSNIKHHDINVDRDVNAKEWAKQQHGSAEHIKSDATNVDCCEVGVGEGVVLQSVTLAPDVSKVKHHVINVDRASCVQAG